MVGHSAYEMEMPIALDEGLAADRQWRPLLLLSELTTATARARGGWQV